MALPASDNFNRVGPTLGANWSAQTLGGGTQAIGSNVVRGVGTFQGSIWNADSFNNDQYSQVTNVDGTNYLAAAVRMSGTSAGTENGYHYFNHGSLQKCVNGTFTEINAGVPTTTTSDTQKISVTGTTISCSKNGGAATDTTDSALSSGSAGIGGYSTGGLDDWSADNVGSSTAIKTWNGLADASVKTFNGLARASVKTRDGLA